MTLTPIVVMASGRGSNFDAILRAIQAGTLAAEIRAVISDKADAPVLAKAKAAGLRAVTIAPESDANVSAQARRKNHEEALLNELRSLTPKFLVMAGYMRILSPHLIAHFHSEKGYSRIVNIHPSLLPSFPGVNGYAQAFQYGSKATGVSVHLVNEEMDNGPILAQESFSIADCESVEEVEARGLAIEHRLFPETLAWVLPEHFRVEERLQMAGSVKRRLCVRQD